MRPRADAGFAWCLCWIISLLAIQSSRGARFYVDSETGDDANSGTLPSQAWKTLERVNTNVFHPGDALLFKSGSRFTGQLAPRGSGAIVDGKVVPITIGKYGGDALPRMDGEGKTLRTLFLHNVEFWDVADLEITNLGTNREPWRAGVWIASDRFGKMRHIHLRGLFVHDINGDLRKDHEGCGIFFESRGGNGSHFDDLLIENCRVIRTDRNGICQRGGSRARSLRVVIRGNVLEDIGGDAIKLWGSNGGVIESNVVHGARMRCEDYAAGIWPFACDDTLVQFNEVSGLKGTKDGQGFDSDYLCRRSVFQYNYSHDNEGGFFLICTPGNSYNEDTVIRYNISQNDGINSARVFQFGGGAKNTRVYNNTIYIGPNQDLPLLSFNEWDGGNASNTAFYNNIFYVDGRVTYRFDKSTNNLFEGNVFFGNHAGIPAEFHAITNKPALRSPGSGGNGFSSLAGYQWTDGNSCLPGKVVPDNGGRDFFGNIVPAKEPPCVGAAQAH